MQLIVTGHLGYVGAVLLPMLLRRGHSVRGIDSGLYEGSAVGPRARIAGLAKDIRDIEPEDLAGADAIVHLAGLSNDPLGELDPAQTFEINHRGAVRLAGMAKEQGIERFVLASTCSVYGAAGDGLVDENSALAPVTAYAKSKLLAERDIGALADETFSLSILRPATVYGPSPMIRFDLAVNNLVAWALATGKVLLKSDGQAWRPFIHIDDLARAFVEAVERRDDEPCSILNVGFTGENYRIREIAEFVAGAVPSAHVEYLPGGQRDQRNYRVSFERLEAMDPGWKPAWTCAEGAEELVTELVGLNLIADDFEGPKFNRVRRLAELLKSGAIGPDMRWPDVGQGPLKRATAAVETV